MCAGAVHTPHLLQLSGIGNGETLRHNDVKVRADLPGVGQNLQVSRLLPLVSLLALCTPSLRNRRVTMETSLVTILGATGVMS